MPCNRKQVYLQHKNYNMKLIEDLFNIFAPHECLGCTKEGELLCQTCRENLSSVPPRCYRCRRWSDGFRTCQRCRKGSSLFEVRAVTHYDGVAKTLVHSLKFARAKAAAISVSRTLASLNLTEDRVLITHVPTVNKRVRERGYDQAALIARALSRDSSQPYLPLLARIGEQRQLGQDRATRTSQMGHAFRVLDSSALVNRHILLVDDVLTTGATCEAAARMLRHAGASKVSAIVFAVA